MRLVSVRTGDGIRLGAVKGDGIVDVGRAGGPSRMQDLIDGGIERVSSIEDLVDGASPYVALEDADLAPPVPTPPNIVCVGRNYPSHVAEEDANPPLEPLLFSKHTSSLRGPVDEIRWSPSVTTQVDFEVELAVVIGRPATNVAIGDAMKFVFGYMSANDVSARDVQFGDGQWYRGKSLESFFPTGPALVTATEIDDPQDLELRCLVNGVEMQVGHTSEMLFSIAEIISYCSRSFTLLPGDIISTGTPSGVGVFRDPPVFLADGDVVEAEVSELGRLRNVCREIPTEVTA
jgi:2-keto-4-pentenoate hydratase/2-oxohepta-3-ene-1,7-dioic acid hydratase in catechol pathway